MRGNCIDLCTLGSGGGACPLPRVCDWRTGACLEPTIRDGGLQPLPEEAIDDGRYVGGGGFTCTTGGIARASVTGVLAAALATALLLARRVRRRGRKRESGP